MKKGKIIELVFRYERDRSQDNFHWQSVLHLHGMVTKYVVAHASDMQPSDGRTKFRCRIELVLYRSKDKKFRIVAVSLLEPIRKTKYESRDLVTNNQ